MQGDDISARIAAWAEQARCLLCVLFGSRARGGPIVKGDVDLALHFEELPDATRRLQIIGELQDTCGSDDVDVAFLHLHTDPVLRFEIFRTGRPLYEARPGLFIDETVRALMLYQDALPFRRALRSRLRQAIADGPVVA